MTITRAIDLDSIQSCASKVTFNVDIDGRLALCEVTRSFLLGDSPTRDDFLTRTDGLLMKRFPTIQCLIDRAFADGHFRPKITILGTDRESGVMDYLAQRAHGAGPANLHGA